jgi:subtilisin family serine protease/outer membrane protein assembly factor BamB
LKNTLPRFAFVPAAVLPFLAALVVSAPSLRADTRAPDAASAPFTAQEVRQGHRDRTVLAKPLATRRADADAAEPREGLRLRRRWDRLGGLRELELLSGETAAAAVARLRASGRYEYVQLDHIYRAAATPNDRDFSRQWALANNGSDNGVAGADIGATRAWDVRTDASNVVVAVIDSGVRYDHPDLVGNMWINPREIPGNGRDDDGNGYIDDVYGINAILPRSAPGAGDPRDDHGHGSHVAGIVGAVGDNGTGIAGVAWKVKIMALKFLRGSTSATAANPAGEGSSSDAVECIDYAIAHGAHLINASYGAAAGAVLQFDPAQFEAVRRARDAGIIVVAAAGNSAADMDLLAHYPASFRLENVVAVANSTNRDDTPVGTNFGSGSVELFAPGTAIYSLAHDATLYVERSGTSMAAPHVAGALALLKAQFPSDSYRQLINRTLRHVDPVSAFSGRVQTGGRLNLDRAIRSTDNRPFNDDFATRARLRGANLAVRSVSTGATVENEPTLAGHAAAATLWWEWTPTISSVVRVSTAGSSFDTVVGIFTGSGLGALTPVAANDDEGPGLTTSRFEFSAVAGTTYFIAVGGKAGAAGTSSGLVLLDLGAIPPNDNFAGALPLTGRSALVSSANAQATREAGEPRIRNLTGGKSLWYRWTAPATHRFQFGLKSDGFDPLLAVYTGSSLAGLNLVGASDNADLEAGGLGASTAAIVTVDAVAGTTYFIQIDGRALGTIPPANAPFILTLNDSLWQGVTGGSVTSAPVIGPDGAVYVGSTDGWFHAFNAGGRRRWPARNLESAQDTSAAALAPDGTLYVSSGPTTAARIDAKLHAFDSATGTRKWDIVVGTGTNANNAVALGADGTIYVHSDEGRLFAYTDHGTSAAPKWSAAVPGTSYASAVIGPDGTIYLGADEGTRPQGHRFFALNPADGSVRWTFNADNAIYTAAALDAAGNIYFGTLTSGRLYSLTSAGQQRWVYTGARLGTSSSPALSPDGRTVYFAGYDGLLHAVDTATGTGRWTSRLGAEVRASSPAVDTSGTIYVGCYDGLLYAVAADGRLQRTWSTGRIVRSSPAISGTTLVVGSNDNGIYAFDIGAAAAGPWPQYRHNSRRTGRAITEPPAIALAPRSQAVVAGGTVTLSVGATGTGPFAYQWTRDGVPLAGATGDTLALAAVTAAETANYAVAVSSSVGRVVSPPAAVVVRGVSEPVVEPRLTNLSVRTTAGSGDRTFIVGFIVAGAGEKSVLLRGIGPGLAGFGVTGTLADPRVQLLSGAGVLAENDNWFTTAGLADAFAAVGAFPLAATARDAALLRPLAAGAYTAQIADPLGSGVALAELYDFPSAAPSAARLANVSARSVVGPGADVLIVGFAIAGNAPKTVLIRAAGPALTALGVGGALADPRLTLFRGAASLDGNDNWTSATLAASFPQVGAFAFASGSRDAALLVSLAPGSYTAQVSGVNDATGVALVEVYALPR